jgi:lysophospholipase L1-like esterase
LLIGNEKMINMKRSGIFLIFVAAFLLQWTCMLASEFNGYRISVNKQRRLLTAPLAVRYQWFYNNERIQAVGRDLKIMGEGIYKVEITDESGQVTERSIMIRQGENGEIYTIYVIGDSTVQDYSSGYYPRKGWGQVLQYFFDTSVKIINKGAGGTSAMSFYNDLWGPIRDALQPGDYVLIQFGINDANSDPLRHTDPFTTFQDYLTSFVSETKAKGAIPVLVATLRRNSWNETVPPTLYPAYHDYPVATRQLAATLNVPLIDLDEMTKPLMESLGPDYTGPFMYMRLDAGEYPNYPNGTADDVHFQEMGAIEMARLVVERIGNLGSDTTINKLIPFIKPVKEVSVTSNFPEGAIFTRTAGYPEGLTVTVKARMKQGYGFVEWQDEQSNQLTANELYSFTMDTSDRTFYAVMDDSPQNLDCTGKNNGTAYFDSCGNCVGGTSGKLPCVIDLPNDTFKIKPFHSGLCVEENSEITQQTCATGKSQSWIFTREGDSYQIQNAATGSYLYSSSLTSGTYLSTSPAPMLWRIELVSDGIYQLIPAGNLTIAVDVYGAYVSAGTRLLLYNRNSNNNQKFRIIPDAPVDCNGEVRGLAAPDVCGICSGGSTGIIPITDLSQCPVSSNTGLEDHTIRIAPNPFTDEAVLTLSPESKTPYDLTLYNMLGAVVLKKEAVAGRELILGSGLGKGLYTGMLIQGKKVWTVRLIKR